MAQSINLIPQQEKQEQQKTAIVKASTVFSIILLIIVAGVSAYFFYETTKYKTQIRDVEDEIEQYRSEITARSQFEIEARNLSQKYKVLQELFKDRNYYSLLLEEFELRKPSGVEVSSFDVRNNVINISGYGVSYISVSDFINSLLGEGTFYETTSSVFGEGAKADLSDLFTKVKLNSVSLDSGNNEVKYSLTIEFEPSKLNKD